MVSASSRTRFAIVPGEAMDGRGLAEGGLELVGWQGCDALRVEMTESLLQLQRSRERGRHGHLLVEGEPDEECERVVRQKLVGLDVPREVDRFRFGHTLDATHQRIREPPALGPGPTEYP